MRVADAACALSGFGRGHVAEQLRCFGGWAEVGGEAMGKCGLGGRGI